MTNDSKKIQHLAIIMDGNGRWAKQRGLPRAIGHQRGVEAVRRTVKAVIDAGIPYLTLYSFSSENWRRPKQEIDELLKLMKRFVHKDLAELHQANVKIRMIGAPLEDRPELNQLIRETEKTTKDNDGLNLTIAFNYGARDEIIRANKKIINSVAKGELSVDEIDENYFDSQLDTSFMPDPDLLIRTSGEYRLSNFLLWQLAYTEFVFLDCFWPEFDQHHLQSAMNHFDNRVRRFGGLDMQSAI